MDNTSFEVNESPERSRNPGSLLDLDPLRNILTPGEFPSNPDPAKAASPERTPGCAWLQQLLTLAKSLERSPTSSPLVEHFLCPQQ